MRGPLLLVCAFLSGTSGMSQVSIMQDVSSGGEVRVSSRALLSFDQVLQRCPTFAHFGPVTDAWFHAAVQRKYLLVSEVPSYGVFVSRMCDAFAVLSDVAGASQQKEAMRAFLELDRRLRESQWSSGSPWDQAFKEAELCRALVSLQLRIASPAPSPSPQGGAKSAGAGKGAQPIRCFAFDGSKESPPACPEGAACKFAAGHKCRKCGSVEHATKACPRSGGGAA